MFVTTAIFIRFRTVLTQWFVLKINSFAMYSANLIGPSGVLSVAMIEGATLLSLSSKKS